jgi:hypothetical protein
MPSLRHPLSFEHKRGNARTVMGDGTDVAPGRTQTRVTGPVQRRCGARGVGHSVRRHAVRVRAAVDRAERSFRGDPEHNGYGCQESSPVLLRVALLPLAA